MTPSIDRPESSSSAQDNGLPAARSGDDNESSRQEPDDEKDWRLDPDQFPRRLELELSDEMLRQLDLLAARSGRDRSEIMLTLIDHQLSQHFHQDQDDPTSA